MLSDDPDKSPLASALDECRPLFCEAFGFGFFINLLMVAVSIYSLQVLDRVLSSGSYEILIWLTLVDDSNLNDLKTYERMWYIIYSVFMDILCTDGMQFEELRKHLGVLHNDASNIASDI